jgi:hypothetical protein
MINGSSFESLHSALPPVSAEGSLGRDRAVELDAISIRLSHEDPFPLCTCLLSSSRKLMIVR